MPGGQTDRGSGQEKVLVTLQCGLPQPRLNAVEILEAVKCRLCILRQTVDRQKRLEQGNPLLKTRNQTKHVLVINTFGIFKNMCTTSIFTIHCAEKQK